MNGRWKTAKDAAVSAALVFVVCGIYWAARANAYPAYDVKSATCEKEDANVCAGCTVAMEALPPPPILTIKCYAYKCENGSVLTKYCKHGSDAEKTCSSGLGGQKTCNNCEKWECTVTDAPSAPKCETTGAGGDCRCPTSGGGADNGNITKAASNCT